MTVAIISLTISSLGLFFAYYRYIKNSPRIDIIELYKSSTAHFDTYIESLDFSYKDQVYPEIVAFEYIIANKSHRSIEFEDVLKDSPIEFYIDSPAMIHDIRLIKKIGESNVEFVKVDEHTIRLDIKSMDKRSSLRVKILCSGKGVKIKSRGKLYKANHSVSKIKSLNGTSISEIVKKLLDGAKSLFAISLFVGIGIASLFTYIEYDDTPEEVKILAPEEYHSVYRQFVLIDSVQRSISIGKLTLIHQSTKGDVDSFNIAPITTSWFLKWWAYNDSIAVALSDSLIAKGYAVEFSNSDSEYFVKKGFEKIGTSRNSKYDVLMKEHSVRYYFDLIKLYFLLFLIITTTVFFYIPIMNAKSIYRGFKYKNFLSDSEKIDIKEEYKPYLIPRLFSKFL
jgi:hypothetical protein